MFRQRHHLHSHTQYSHVYVESDNNNIFITLKEKKLPSFPSMHAGWLADVLYGNFKVLGSVR